MSSTRSLRRFRCITSFSSAFCASSSVHWWGKLHTSVIRVLFGYRTPSATSLLCSSHQSKLLSLLQKPPLVSPSSFSHSYVNRLPIISRTRRTIFMRFVTFDSSSRVDNGSRQANRETAAIFLETARKHCKFAHVSSAL